MDYKLHKYINTNEHVKKKVIQFVDFNFRNLQWDAQKCYCHWMKMNVHKTFLK